MKKFDFVIGNPPYQSENALNNRQSPVYNLFMDEAYKAAKTAELITPARFLFDAGQTPSEWNKKMLQDEHLKVLHYEPDCTTIFPNTDIKGGIAITIRSDDKEYGSIGVFTKYPLLNEIAQKVNARTKQPFSSCAYSKSYYHFSEAFYSENPELKCRLTKGNEYIIDAKIFEKMPEVFFDEPFSNAIAVHGREKAQRVVKYIKHHYIRDDTGVDKYKVFVTGANGSGEIGIPLSSPFVARPGEISTQTYMSFGFFDKRDYSENCLKYIKTKFARCLLAVLKVTQNNPRETWSKIPLQDFTERSDIDWFRSIPEIDQQLYKKYDLTQEEIDFIETHVKEMV